MSNQLSKPINTVADLILHRGDTVESMKARWSMPTDAKWALQQMAKLWAMPHAPSDAAVDQKVKMASYVEALVEERVPAFALSDAVARFQRGHVQGQSDFVPSIKELLEECHLCFVARLRFAPDHEGGRQPKPQSERQFSDLPQWMQDRIVANRRAYGQSDTTLPYHRFLQGLVHEATAEIALKSDIHMNNGASMHAELLRVSAEAAAKRKAAYEKMMRGREDRGIDYE